MTGQQVEELLTQLQAINVSAASIASSLASTLVTLQDLAGVVEHGVTLLGRLPR